MVKYMLGSILYINENWFSMSWFSVIHFDYKRVECKISSKH